MNARLKLLATVLRKDLQLFWPLAVLTALLNAVANYDSIMRKLAVIEPLVMPAVLVATGLFILQVFHEDSAVTGKRDWLTRPVPGLTMLAAKCLFAVLVVVLPPVLGSIVGGLHLGRPPLEVLVTSMAEGLGGVVLLVFLCTVAFAALTSSIRQAIVVLLAGIVLLLFGFIYFSGTIVYPLPFWFADSVGPASGSEWILTRPLELLLAFTALAALWILYRRRHGRRAALLLVCVAVLAGGALLATMSRSRMFGLQKWLSPDPAAASTVAASLQPGCFPARTLAAPNESDASPGEKITAGIFPPRQRMQAGADAVAFVVRLVVDRLPQGGQLVGRAQLTYRTSDGGTVSLGAGSTSQPSDQHWVKTESGQRAMEHYWLLSKKDYQRLAADPGTTAHFDYSMSLLEPKATAVFAADGRRAYRPGIGYCGTTVSGVAKWVNVGCYSVGDQPALLAARLDAQPDIEDRASGQPDFTPVVLDFWGGHRHRMYVADATGLQVRVTAYEARAHFTRQFDVPGVLGGPVSSCPLP
jgi:hypothetical protein